MSQPSERASTTSGSWFYVWYAVAINLFVLVAFAPSYWLQLPAGTVIAGSGLHFHAFLFAAWPLLFLLQSWFVATGRIRRHRAWGLLGIALATAMLFSGVDSSFREMKHGLSQGETTAIQFALGPIIWILVFAGLFTAAIIKVANKEAHKRLILLATVAIMPASVGHVFFSILVGDGPGIRPGLHGDAPIFILALFPVIADLLLILPAIIYDWRTRGRPHVVYIMGGTIMILVHLSIVPLSATNAWQAIAKAMTGL